MRWIKQAHARSGNYFFLLGFIILLCCSYSRANQPTEIIGYIEGIINKHPKIKSDQYRYIAQTMQLKSRKSKSLPDLNLSGDVYLNKNIEEDSKLGNSIYLTAQYDIFNKYQSEEIKAQEYQAIKQKISNTLSKKDLIYQILISLLQVERDITLKNNSESHLARIERHYQATKKRAYSGELTKTDIFQSQTRLKNQVIAVKQKENIVKFTQSKIKGLTGKNPPNHFKVPSFDKLFEKMDFKFDKEQTKSLPTVVKSEIRIKSLNLKIKSVEKKIWPTITAQASYRYDYPYNKNQFELENEARISINLNWNLYEGGENKYQKKNLIHEKMALSKYHHFLKHQIKTKIENDFDILKSEQNIFKELQNVKEISLNTIKGIEQEFIAGTRSSTDFLNAEKELLNIEEKIIVSKYKIIQLKYQIIWQLGLMDLDYLKRYI